MDTHISFAWCFGKRTILVEWSLFLVQCIFGASGRVLPPVTGRPRVRVAVSSHYTGEGKVCHWHPLPDPAQSGSSLHWVCPFIESTRLQMLRLCSNLQACLFRKSLFCAVLQADVRHAAECHRQWSAPGYMLDLQISVLEIIEAIKVSFKAHFLSFCSFVPFNVVGNNVVAGNC